MEADMTPWVKRQSIIYATNAIRKEWLYRVVQMLKCAHCNKIINVSGDDSVMWVSRSWELKGMCKPCYDEFFDMKDTWVFLGQHNKRAMA
jgi:hypothetical protein